MTNQRYNCDCGCMGLGPALSAFVGALGPEEARNHFRASRVEFLKGIRALLDARIEYLSKATETGTKVDIE
jgi:hypothetical protein